MGARRVEEGALARRCLSRSWAGPELHLSGGAGTENRIHHRYPPSEHARAFDLRDMPTYAQLMDETDEEGHNHSYLASAQNFRLLQDLERRNVVIPIVGDFAGDKTLRAVGKYVREHDATVTAFYTSNVEQY